MHVNAFFTSGHAVVSIDENDSSHMANSIIMRNKKPQHQAAVYFITDQATR
ncbi:hypothetical protein [Vogesella sp. XCS3]|uniref:hypothetical protein n=1 Tax=Vogesella sp. XCS3 TaxID=2877939 RepID=UPI001D0BD36E|nr:hypothetical protein [Vogesella sp. XCS3]UDM16540.1 hypothetical protein LCH97_14775 [Vogesella sp. XCS3]